MAKTVMIVTITVITIIMLFLIFSYLLSNVNPDPIVTNGTYDRKSQDMQGLIEGKADVIYPHDELSAKDDVHFGLEKVPDDYEINTPYESARKSNADIDKRFAYQKPVSEPVATVKGIVKYAEQTLTTDGKKPVTLIVFPLKDNRRLIREKNMKNVDKNPRNILLKIVDDSGEAKLEVIADSAQLIYKGESNKTKKDLDDNVVEIRANNTLLYNMKDQSLKIVDNKVSRINNTLYNSTLIPKHLKDKLVILKSSTIAQSTDKTDSSLPLSKPTTEPYVLTTNFICNNLSVLTKLTTLNDSLTVMSC